MRLVFHEPYTEPFGGAQRGLLTLIDEVRDEAEVILIVTGEGIVADAARRRGVRVIVDAPPSALRHYGYATGLRSGSGMWRAASTVWLPYNLSFAKRIRGIGADALICNTQRSAVLLAPQRWILNTPVIAYVRSTGPVPGRASRQLVRRSADYYIAVSEEVGRTFALPPTRTMVIENGIPVPADWSSDGATGGARARRDGLVLLAVANVVEHKGYRDLLAAYARVADLHPRWRLRIVGSTDVDPILVKDLQREAEESDIPVQLAGFRTDMGAEYAGADLFVLPSHEEGFPRSLLEAMLRGLPAVATDVSGVATILKGAEGWIARARDSEDLARALHEAMCARERTPSLGLSNTEVVRARFTASRVAAQFMECVRGWANAS